MAPVSYCPDVVRAQCYYRVELVVCSWNVRTWNHLPTCTVPVLDKGLRQFVDIRKAAYSPHIVRRVRRHCVKRVKPKRAGAGAGNDAPSCAIPVQDQRGLVETDAAGRVAYGPYVRRG